MRQPRKRVTVYIDEDLHMELKIKAARSGATVSDWVNHMVTESIERETPRPDAEAQQEEFEEILKALREAGS